MPQGNLDMDDEENKKLQDRIKKHEKKSMSEFIPNIIHEKIKTQELITKTERVEDQEIPCNVPKYKYVIFVKGALVAVGENPCELAERARKKFPTLPFVIKLNGPKPKSMEYFHLC